MTYSVINFTGNATTLNIIPAAPFVDWRLWLLFLGISVTALVMSHASKRGNDFWAILAFVFAIFAAWSSLGLASFNTPIVYSALSNATVTENSTITSANISTYYSVQALNSPWLTLAMIVWAAILLLNIIYVYVEVTTPQATMQTPDTGIQVGREEVGRYYK
jgi:hypothetical protein